MRFTNITFLAWACAAALRAQPLPLPTSQAPLYAHLCEVNRQWLEQATPTGLTDEVQFPTDIHRIQRHLELVGTTLAQRPTDALSPTQRRNRLAALSTLKGYWQAALFPVNLHHTERIPVFVDDRGTACAVGYLLLATGEDALVRRIHETHNYASIEELLTYPEIQTWAHENGFTTDELAWIQPGYAVVIFIPKPFGNNLGTEGGYVRDMRTWGSELLLAGDFTRIDGFEAATIAAWDGDAFRALPGLTGSIRRLATDEVSGHLLALGTFPGLAAPTDTALLAQYQNGTWTPLLYQSQVTSNGLGGTLTDIICHNGVCLLSGNFTALDGQPLHFLARYDLSTQQWQAASNHFTFTGPIADMDWLDDQLLLGGTFNLLSGADTVSRTLAWLDAGADTLIQGFDFMENPAYYQSVTSIEQVGFDYDPSRWLSLGRSDDGQVSGLLLWPYPNSDELWPLPLSSELEPSPMITINGIHQGWQVFGQFNSHGIIGMPGQSASSAMFLASTNAPVTAMTWYGDQYIIAGEFTTIGDSLFRHLTCATLRVTSTNDALAAPPAFTLGTDGVTLFMDNIPPSSAALQLELFDMQGRLSWQYTLPQGTTKHHVALPNLPSGVYAYRVYNAQLIGAGQVVAIGLQP